MDPKQEVTPRLFTSIIEERARDEPDRVFTVIPAGETLDDGFQDITYKIFANAIDCMVLLIEDSLNQHNITAPGPIGYLGPNDLRYHLFVHACMRISRPALFPSLNNNSPDAQPALLDASKCLAIFSPPSLKSAWEPTLTSRPSIPYTPIPSVSHFTTHAPIPPIPTTKSYADLASETAYIIQTSGTTGQPRPLHWTHAALSLYASDMAASQSSDPADKLLVERLHGSSTRYLCPIPLNWAAGLQWAMHMPLIYGSVPILLPGDLPPPPSAGFVSYLHRVHEITKPNVGVFVPALLARIVADEQHRAMLKDYRVSVYGGAGLEKGVGDLVAEMCPLVTGIGSTDLGFYPLVGWGQPGWDWFRLRELDGFEMVDFAEGLREIVVHRMPGESRPAFLMGEDQDQDLQIFRTSDLCEEHPEQKGWWRIVGRADDFVKLRDLTKFNAVNVEKMVIGDGSVVEACLVGGEGRDRSFVVVQPSARIRDDGKEDAESVKEAVWKVLEDVNARLDVKARFGKDMVIFTNADKPILKTAKGSTQRKATLDAYQAEISGLYKES